MTLLFVDGFDHYATGDFTKKWNSVTGAPTVNGATGRRGTRSLRVGSINRHLTRNFAAISSWVIGFAFKFTTSPTSASPICVLLDSGTVQCDLRVNPDLTISVTRNGNSLTGGTSANAFALDSFYYVEFKVTIADSIAASSCVVRVNGVAWLTVATGQDTKNTANTTANQLRLGINSSLSTAALGSADFDDLYVCDQSGSTNNDFLGDVRVDTLFPNSDGAFSDFTPSTGSTHYVLVDEDEPNTTDYNDGLTVGDRDSYGMGNLAALSSQTVYGVQVNAALNKDDAGAKSAATFVRSGSTNADGALSALGTSQAYVSQVFEEDPDASGAWTETTVNAMEAGVVVTA